MAKNELYPLNGKCPEGHIVTSVVNDAGYCDECQKGDAHEGPVTENETTGIRSEDEKKSR